MAFVAIFLLREWITQNARPGVFDEAEAPPEGAVQVIPEPVIPIAPAVAPVPALPPPPPAPAPAPAPVGRIWERPARPILPAPPRDAIRDIEAKRHLRERAAVRWALADPGSDDEPAEGPEAKGKDRQLNDGFAFDGPSTGVKRRHSWNDGYEWTPTPSRSPSFSSATKRPKRDESMPESEESSAVEDREAELSAKVEPVPDDWKLDFSSWDPLASSSQNQNAPVTKKEEEILPPPTPGKSSSRPPLFSTALFTPAEPGSPPQILPQPSRGNTPLASPHLATYRAPEEFEAGPSNLGYFQDHRAEEQVEEEESKQTDGINEEEWETYFREATPEEAAQVARKEEEANAPQDVEENEGEVDVDVEMPALQQWTDEEEDGEEDEEEDGPDAVVDFEAPAPDVPDENDDRLEEVREEVMPVANGPDAEALDLNDELEGGMEDDMEGALEGELGAPEESMLMYILQTSWLQSVFVVPSMECSRTSAFYLSKHRCRVILTNMGS